MGSASLLAGRSILVVEDEPLIAMDVAALIADYGGRSLLVRTCKQAIELAETEHLSAAILDYGCGDVHQITSLCGHLAKRRISYLFYTGYDNVDESCRDVLLVRKPATGEALLRALTQLMLPSSALPAPTRHYSISTASTSLQLNGG
jgi:DNA-binding response OmpR family regulator